MTVLGAIFAGGAARRFGGGKHAALIDGTPMIDHVIGRLRPQCDALVIVGLDWPGFTRIDDVPRPGLGPLGALAGALAYAREAGFDQVLTSGCDLPDLPKDLRQRLEPASAVVKGQPLLGLWDSAQASALAAWLGAGRDQAMRAWVMESGARIVSIDAPLSNINTFPELAAYLSRQGR